MSGETERKTNQEEQQLIGIYIDADQYKNKALVLYVDVISCFAHVMTFYVR